MNKRMVFKWMAVLGFTLMCQMGYGQSAEAKQLLLNVEKLSQLKSILSNMKKGYTVLSNGYNSVKNIAEGNFSLHEVFLDGLMLVSPEVKKYHKVPAIIADQADLVREYKSAFGRFSSGGNFSGAELGYVAGVYDQLLKESLTNLDRLLLVVTSSKLRMSDEERLSAIDRIYEDTADKLVFLRAFNQKAGMLGVMRAKEKAEISRTGTYYNLK